MNRCSRFASLLVVSLSALGLFSAGPAPAAELGRVAFVNSGSEEAQEPFQQGVAALHSFFYDEAADLFREAQRRDPGFAMAYWGEALTHNHPLWRQQDRDAALEALGKLAPTRQERAAKAPTERERAYLETVEILYGDGEKHERDVAYREALRRLAERFPDDPEARALHALAIQGAAETAHQTGGADVIPARMESAGILEELFDRHPDHPGVLHYLIHAYDDPVHAPLGLRPARIYAEVAPEANHALHMPSHIFLQLGMWERVVASNEDAVAASEAWVERRGHARDKIDLHSLSWLHYARLQLGQTEAGARATMSHTGSLAAPQAVWDGMMRQCGAITTNNLDETVLGVSGLSVTATSTGAQTITVGSDNAAISADAEAGTDYALSKKRADDYLKALDLDWVVLRPSLIYGEGAYRDRQGKPAYPQRREREQHLTEGLPPAGAVDEGSFLEVKPLYARELIVAGAPCDRPQIETYELEGFLSPTRKWWDGSRSCCGPSHPPCAATASTPATGRCFSASLPPCESG